MPETRFAIIALRAESALVFAFSAFFRARAFQSIGGRPSRSSKTRFTTTSGTGLGSPDMLLSTTTPMLSLGSQAICEMKPSMPPPCCTHLWPR